MNRRIFISSIFSAAAFPAITNFEKVLGQSVENKSIIKSEGVFVKSNVREEIYDFKVLRADHPDSRGHIYSKNLLNSLANTYTNCFTTKGNLILEDKCKLVTCPKYRSISLGSENTTSQSNIQIGLDYIINHFPSDAMLTGKFDDFGPLFIAHCDVFSHKLKNFYLEDDYLIARIGISPCFIQKTYLYSPESIRLLDCLKNHTIPITMRIAGLGSFEKNGKYINVSDDFKVLSVNAVPIDKAVKI